jgi:hypothetical protein
VTDKSSEFFEGTEMPTAGWWQALWHNPASVVAAIDLAHRMEVVDLCCGDRCFTLQIAKVARGVIANRHRSGALGSRKASPHRERCERLLASRAGAEIDVGDWPLN